MTQIMLKPAGHKLQNPILPLDELHIWTHAAQATNVLRFLQELWWYTLWLNCLVGEILHLHPLADPLVHGQQVDGEGRTRFPL